VQEKTDPKLKKMPSPPVPLLELDHPTEDLVTCNVCMQMMLQHDPLVLAECGHTLCRKCVASISEKRPSSTTFACPFCRRETLNTKINVNYNVRDFISKIQCACGEAPAGCMWSGAVAAYGEHVEKHCPFSRKPCKYRKLGCYENLVDGDREQHERLCNCGPWTCGYCGEKGFTQSHADWHLANACKSFPHHICVEGCGFSGTREQVVNHQKRECKVMSYNCPMNNCTFKANREDMIAHLRTNHSCARGTQRFDTLFAKRKAILNSLIAIECNLSLLKPEVSCFERHAPWNDWVRDIAQSSGFDPADPGVTVFALVQVDGLA
jgi:hypothetical protein